MEKNKNKKSKKKKAQQKDGAKLYIFSFLKTLAVFAVLFTLSVLICYKGGVSREKYFIFFIASGAISSFIGGFILASKKKKRGVLNGIIGGIPVIFASIVIILAANGPTFSVKTLILMLSTLILSIFGGFSAVNIRR